MEHWVERAIRLPRRAPGRALRFRLGGRQYLRFQLPHDHSAPHRLDPRQRPCHHLQRQPGHLSDLRAERDPAAAQRHAAAGDVAAGARGGGRDQRATSTSNGCVRTCGRRISSPASSSCGKATSPPRRSTSWPARPSWWRSKDVSAPAPCSARSACSRRAIGGPMSVRCSTEVHAAIITYDQFKQLYFQNPQFGFVLLRLIVARLHGNAELSRPAKLS